MPVRASIFRISRSNSTKKKKKDTRDLNRSRTRPAARNSNKQSFHDIGPTGRQQDRFGSVSFPSLGSFKTAVIGLFLSRIDFNLSCRRSESDIVFGAPRGVVNQGDEAALRPIVPPLIAVFLRLPVSLSSLSPSGREIKG